MTSIDSIIGWIQHKMSIMDGIEETKCDNDADAKQQIGKIPVGMADGDWADVGSCSGHYRTFIWTVQLQAVCIQLQQGIFIVCMDVGEIGLKGLYL